MKKIYFIRHAKAVEESEGGDFERDLSERGKKDLALMCERLKKHEVRADAIFASPAKRCAKTVQKLAAAVKFEKKSNLKTSSTARRCTSFWSLCGSWTINFKAYLSSRTMTR